MKAWYLRPAGRWMGAAGVVLFSVLTACGGSEFSAADASGGAAGSGMHSGGSGGATGGTSSAGTGGSGGSSAGTGGSSAGSGGSSERSVLDACLALVTAGCEWQERCLGQKYYPSTDVCFEQTRHYCDDGGYGIGLPGTSLASADLDACTATVESRDCNRAWPTCTLPEGELGTGEPCQSAYQCASSRCSGNGLTCGTCLPPAGAPGTACLSATDCRPGATCIDGVCLKNSLEGEPCSDDAPCAAPIVGDTVPDGRLLCVEGTCEVVGRLGEPCYNDTTAVDLCGYLTACSAERTCVPVERVASGEPCGTFTDSVRICDVGSCLAPAESGPTVCVPGAGPGEECNPQLQNCAWSLECTTGGRCAWPAPGTVTPCEE